MVTSRLASWWFRKVNDDDKVKPCWRVTRRYCSFVTDVDAGLPVQEDVMLKWRVFAKPAECCCIDVTVAAKKLAISPSKLSAWTQSVRTCWSEWFLLDLLLLPDQYVLETNLLAGVLPWIIGADAVVPSVVVSEYFMLLPWCQFSMWLDGVSGRAVSLVVKVWSR